MLTGLPQTTLMPVDVEMMAVEGKWRATFHFCGSHWHASFGDDVATSCVFARADRCGCLLPCVESESCENEERLYHSTTCVDSFKNGLVGNTRSMGVLQRNFSKLCGHVHIQPYVLISAGEFVFRVPDDISPNLITDITVSTNVRAWDWPEKQFLWFVRDQYSGEVDTTSELLCLFEQDIHFGTITGGPHGVWQHSTFSFEAIPEKAFRPVLCHTDG